MPRPRRHHPGGREGQHGGWACTQGRARPACDAAPRLLCLLRLQRPRQHPAAMGGWAWLLPRPLHTMLPDPAPPHPQRTSGCIHPHTYPYPCPPPPTHTCAHTHATCCLPGALRVLRTAHHPPACAGFLLWFGQYGGVITTYARSSPFSTVYGPFWKVRVAQTSRFALGTAHPDWARSARSAVLRLGPRCGVGDGHTLLSCTHLGHGGRGECNGEERACACRKRLA